jgi:hypothetical protein
MNYYIYTLIQIQKSYQYMIDKNLYEPYFWESI